MQCSLSTKFKPSTASSTSLSTEKSDDGGGVITAAVFEFLVRTGLVDREAQLLLLLILLSLNSALNILSPIETLPFGSMDSNSCFRSFNTSNNFSIVR